MTDSSIGQRIVPHLWFDDQAEEAVEFYTDLFPDSRIGGASRYSEAGKEVHGRPAGSVMNVEFELAGYSLIALNGGPQFTFTPAISFFVRCGSEAEVDRLWEELSEAGSALMDLGEYEWSEKYGWLEDRYGLSWQIALQSPEEVRQKITPCLMYVGEEPLAEEALRTYTSVFENVEITGILRAGNGSEGAVRHAQFTLAGQMFMAMDGSADMHDFTFNEAISLLVNCETQEEIDHYWEALTQGDAAYAQQCGWLKDRFGVSWQVNPVQLREMLQDENEERVERVMGAFMAMEKFDIGELQAAYHGS